MPNHLKRKLYSTRHYKHLAESIKKCEFAGGPDVKLEIAATLGAILKLDNPNFKTQIFLKDCGLIK